MFEDERPICTTPCDYMAILYGMHVYLAVFKLFLGGRDTNLLLGCA